MKRQLENPDSKLPGIGSIDDCLIGFPEQEVDDAQKANCSGADQSEPA